jgi:hypothetical protein
MKIPMKCARLTALLAALALTATACSTSKKPPQAQAKQAAATPTTTLAPDAAQRAEVLAAYGEYRRFYEKVIANPDPGDPALAAHLAGAALGAMQRDQAGFQSTHEGERLTDVTDHPKIVSIDSGGARAVVDECVLAIAHYFDTRTSQPMGAPPGTAPTSEGFEFVFVKDAGAWKVSEKHSKAGACQQI